MGLDGSEGRTGTGHFARAAAAADYRVTAVDVSEMMLRYAHGAAEKEGLAIEFVHEGFLTFEGAAMVEYVCVAV